MKRTQMRAVSPLRLAANKARKAVERALYEAAPWCARCGRTDVELHGHERLGRAQGGDAARPDCLLCNTCNTWCEDNPREAAETGWKISRKYGGDAA